ncbi:tumor necrosis factor receptor superfamily member 4 isoform X2 [Bufo gargarizans]|uniref:tumor necrosis factor receptor superfamily member 4 isoform X2 n=1 Tax=Bufo gargarizans TaxID=30331 RepID=UPI001CF448E7|nr:tumor necrosis factor receptor superfamily member 4 isoform X2 [Bufo gargarizans]
MAGGSLCGTALLLHCALLLAAAAMRCPQDQYVDTAEGRDVCCNYCAAGQEISEVCTPWNKASKCTNCKENHYNPKNARDRCKRCTVCNKECQPCKSGYFSAKENGACRLWTNCSAIGQKVLEQGSATEDVKCTIPTPVTAGLPATSWTSTSSSHRRNVTSLKNFTTTNHIPITPHLPTPSNIDWGTLSLIVIGVVLLLASAGVILTTLAQINRKKTNRRFIRGERCKVPVQEESTSSDSSLTKDCPA